MREISKAAKKHFRKLAAVAYERELDRALDMLFSQFQDWKKKKLNAFELDEEVHKHHQGISRDLYKRYEYGEPTFMVARALVIGLIKEDEIDKQHLPMLAGAIELFKFFGLYN